MEKFSQLLKSLEEVLLSDENKSKILDTTFRRDILEQKFSEFFNVSIEKELKPRVAKYVENNAEKIASTITNVAPYNDYAKLTYDKAEIAQFLKTECSKPENWKVKSLDMDNIASFEVVKVTFCCSALDENDQEFEGFSFVNNNGKVKHTFAVYNGK